jgi:hypothetical protein
MLYRKMSFFLLKAREKPSHPLTNYTSLLLLLRVLGQFNSRMLRELLNTAAI